MAELTELQTRQAELRTRLHDPVAFADARVGSWFELLVPDLRWHPATEAEVASRLNSDQQVARPA